MNDNIEKTIERIQRLCLDADIETNEGIRHFHHGHEYVEIGGMKWATMNIGATSKSDGGLYFQWGDVQGYSYNEIIKGKMKNFCWNDYIFCNEGYITKYYHIDDNEVLEPIDDAAHVHWGGKWRTPTINEFAALKEATDITWKSNYYGNGVNGIVLTDKNNIKKKMFIQAMGYGYGEKISRLGLYGRYWSSCLIDYSCNTAKNLNFSSIQKFLLSLDARFLGCPIRAIVGD